MNQYRQIARIIVSLKNNPEIKLNKIYIPKYLFELRIIENIEKI